MSGRDFDRMPWPAIVALIGGKDIKPARKGEFTFTLLPNIERGRAHARVLLISDNGGEVNISERGLGTPGGWVPVYDGSVVFHSIAMGPVGPLTMASRLLDALEGREIDYKDYDRCAIT